MNYIAIERVKFEWYFTNSKIEYHGDEENIWYKATGCIKCLHMVNSIDGKKTTQKELLKNAFILTQEIFPDLLYCNQSL